MGPHAGTGGCGVSANEYSCAHGAQIKFWDLTSCLTYGIVDKLYKNTEMSHLRETLGIREVKLRCLGKKNI